jgi:hypothetical protein
LPAGGVMNPRTPSLLTDINPIQMAFCPATLPSLQKSW